MLIILEGLNGVGKSTYAKALAVELGATVYRPFRTHSDEHFNGQTKIELELKALGVPSNTYLEDIFAADFLGKLAPRNSIRVILDRSLPSAVVYGSIRQYNAEALLALWQELLRPEHALYVWLRAKADVRTGRLVGRGTDHLKTSELMERKFQMCFGLITMPKLVLETDIVSLEEGVQILLKKVLGKAR